MTPSINPLDPEMIKIPAFQRKRSLSAKARRLLAWTALDRKKNDTLETAIPDELSSVKSVARSARNTRRVLTPLPRDVKASSFQRISLEQTSILDRPIVAHDRDVESALRRYVLVGEITMVLTKISVGILKLSQSIRLGDVLLFESGEDECMYEERISEMQINRKNVKTAKKGAEIGMKMQKLPRNGTKVWRISPAS